MRPGRITALLCVLVLLICLAAPAVSAAEGDTVYVRKHVSLLYDNSGSMKMKLTGARNLKWAYGSYAAQMFAGLLNDMDTLSVTFMNSRDADGNILSSQTRSIDLDMTGDRQAQVTRLLEETSWATGNTPVTSIHDALDVLIRQGLKSDEELLGAEVSDAEQYWLVLTTDGVFDSSEAGREEYYNFSASEVVAVIDEILDDYSSLQVVYFALGAKNDTSKYKAIDFGKYSQLTAYPNFTSFYAEDQDEIVSTMQDLSNRISGRYAVSEGVSASGSTVTMTISGESSPVRNIAVLAQNTNARLVSAKMRDGTVLDIVRGAEVAYPSNPDYDQMDPGTMGGYSAVVSCEAGKIPAGEVVLTFDRDVSGSDLSLMYEPAIYVALSLQRQNGDEWENVPYGSKLVEGDTLRVGYTICEDGSDTPIDPARLPGKTVAQLSCDGEIMELDEPFAVKAGSSVLSATVSMMDGAYCVTTSRTIKGAKFTDFQVSSSGPLAMQLNALKENRDLHIDFTVTMAGTPATREQLDAFALDQGGLAGTVDYPGDGVIRFTPCAPDGKSGSYTVTLSCDAKTKASESVTVEPNPTTYSAEAGEAFAIYDKDVSGNTEGVRFFVTAHKDEGDFPVTVEESFAFSVKAENSQGQALDGTLKFVTDGEIAFVPGGDGAQVGDYTVTLYFGNQTLAVGQVSVLRYNAQYAVEAILPENTEVRRFDLLHNETSVDFVVYADGVPCTAEQLEAMLGGMILTEMDRENRLIRLDVTVENRDGISVVRARPASTTRSGFIAFFQKAFIALGWFGGVPKGDLTIHLAVDAEKGDSASGLLQLVSTPFEDMFFMILLAAIIAVSVLVGLFIYSNLRMSRIKPGRMYYYEIAPDGSGFYYVRSRYSKKVYTGLQPRLQPTPQRMLFKGMRFAADKNDKPAGKWGKKRIPAALLKGKHSYVLSFCAVDQSDDADALIKELKGTGSDPEIMAENFIKNISCTTLVEDEDEHNGEAYSVPYRMKENGFLQQRCEGGVIKIWLYRPFTRKRRGKKKRKLV